MELLLAIAGPIILAVMLGWEIRKLNRCSMRIMHRRHRTNNRRRNTLESLFEPAIDNESPTDHLTRNYGDN